MKTPWYMQQKLPVVLVAGLGGLFTVVDLACAQPWAATTAPNLSWSALAASADGTRLVAAANTRSYGPGFPAPIYISTNAGASWAQTSAPSNNWSSVACSADGTKLVAVAASGWGWGGTELVFCEGAIYGSLDSGTTWAQTSAPTNYWTSVASSADGARLVAVAAPQWVWNGTNYDSVGDGTIYRSLDSGAIWTRTSAPTNYWTSVASSADGAKLVAVTAPHWVWNETNSDYIGDGAIYRSLDSGATWTQTSAPSNGWSAVATSTDGVRLVAAAAPYSDGNGDRAGDGAIYSSLDSGATWSRTSAPSNYWSAVASSADGTKLVAADGSYNPPDLVYISTNSGTSWTDTSAPGCQWAAVASSADGYRIVAGGYGTPLYTLPYSGPWRLADAPARDWRDWSSVACSADGTRLIATEFWPGVYTSSNSGTAWTQTAAPTNIWRCVASSADGAKLVAAAGPNDSGDGLIYTSSNSGTTWAPTSARSNRWVSVASSADGTKLVAVAGIDPPYGGDGLIYTSSNSGATWMRTSAPSNGWTSVASSTDGTKLVAVADPNYGGDGLIYTSSNSGVTWTSSSTTTNGWSSVASSADGAKLVAVAALFWDPNVTNYAGDGAIYRSADAGSTWTRTSAPSNGWSCVASSADGNKLVALTLSGFSGGEGVGEVYVSTNSGVTWAPPGLLPAAGWWFAIASSADGSNIVVVGGSQICTLRSPAPVPPLPPALQLAVGLSGATLGLSCPDLTLVPGTWYLGHEALSRGCV